MSLFMPRLLGAASGLILAAAPAAFAQAKVNTVNNSQKNWADTRATINANLSKVTEDVSMTSASIANSFSATLGGNSTVNNFQDSWRNGAANLNIRANDTLGSLTATAATIGNSASIEIDALAGGSTSGNSVVRSTQLTHLGRFTSNLNIEGANISGSTPEGGGPVTAITGTAAAIANSLSVNVKGDLNATNTQYFNGDVRSTINAKLNDIRGDVTLTSAAIANSASFDTTDSQTVNIRNTQMAGYDPTALTNLQLGKVVGDVSVTTAAISNSLSVSTLPATASLNVNSNQQNRAYTEATANINLGDVTGSVSATSAAIGNSVSINNLPKF